MCVICEVLRELKKKQDRQTDSGPFAESDQYWEKKSCLTFFLVFSAFLYTLVLLTWLCHVLFSALFPASSYDIRQLSHI